MNTQQTDRSAFPAYDPVADTHSQGMTLRDYFAAAAMHGICARIELHEAEEARCLVERAFLIADMAVKASQGKPL